MPRALSSFCAAAVLVLLGCPPSSAPRGGATAGPGAGGNDSAESAISLDGSADDGTAADPLGDAEYRLFADHVSGLPLASRPDLQTRVRSEPHAYFRLLSVPFAQSVCRRFAATMATLPAVNLHGDAHFEQFTVKRKRAELSDYDDASFGPAVIDLVRFAASLRLTCAARGWDCADRAIDEFLASYKRAITDPAASEPPPTIARRLRQQISTTTEQFLDRTTALMQPIPDDRLAAFEDGYRRYVDYLRKQRSDFSRAFFARKAFGRHGLGLGSALTRKVLIRIEGPSPAPADDVIIEFKELSDLSPVPCVVARPGDAL
ncbi:MAG: DUF2252 family protein, partial [Myxococcota bacterium]